MEQIPQESLPELQLDHETSAHFQAAGRWARFIAIVLFIFIGFFLLMLLVLGMGDIGKEINFNTLPGVSPKLQLIVFTVFLIPFTLLVIQLYRFANRTRQGIQRQDQELLNNGLKSLRIYFSVYGVLSILSLIASLFNLINLI